MAEERRSTSSRPLTVAVEVSALHGTSHRDAEFVAFVLGTLDQDDELHALSWSVARGRSSGRHDDGRRTRAWVGHRAASTGLRIPSSWAAPKGDVVFFASGPLDLFPSSPGVVTVQVVDGPHGVATSRRRSEQLRRAAGEGIVLHAPTAAVAEALVALLDVPRTSIVVAAPGVRVTSTVTDRVASVVVLGGTDDARDLEVLEALRGAGLDAELERSPHAMPRAACTVVASSDEGFPTAAMEVLAAGGPGVSVRTSATTALLGGAATLVDPTATNELVDMTVDLVRNDASRAIAAAAGRARAEDFSWARRGPELVRLLRRASAPA